MPHVSWTNAAAPKAKADYSWLPLFCCFIILTLFLTALFVTLIGYASHAAACYP